MSSVPEIRRKAPDGRKIVDELPCRVGLLPGEVDLVATYLMGALETLFAEESDGSKSPMADTFKPT